MQLFTFSGVKEPIRFPGMYSEWPRVSLKAALCIISISSVINKQKYTLHHRQTRQLMVCLYFWSINKQVIHKHEVNKLQNIYYKCTRQYGREQWLTTMWRPPCHRWHTLFNAAKFGWHSLLECRVSRYQKEHSPTHHPDHQTIFISFFHLPRSIA